MGISDKLVNAAYKAKPVIKKIVPEKILHSAKAGILDHQFKQIVDKGRQPFDRKAYPDGINLIGLLRAQMGLGQSARLIANELKHSDINYALYNFEMPFETQFHEDHSLDALFENEYKYNINLIHINPYEITYLYRREDPKLWNKRYNIGFWLWELRDIPDSWIKCVPMLDEIWTPSDFITKSFKKVVNVPVKTMPYCVTVDASEKYDRAYFGLPDDKFVFLVMYHSNSTMAPKNPVGAIKAYKRAFREEKSDVGIVIKINNPRPQDIEHLKKGLAGYKNVYFLTDTYTKQQVDSLIKDIDVFVSLHRAEGYGLVMAEAMLLGTPCIATNWSSNTEFMNNDVACMVDYSFSKLERDYPPYKAGVTWAEPDLSHAAKYMRQLYKDRTFYNKLRTNARIYAGEKMSMGNAVSCIEKRVKEIYER